MVHGDLKYPKTCFQKTNNYPQIHLQASDLFLINSLLTEFPKTSVYHFLRLRLRKNCFKYIYRVVDKGEAGGTLDCVLNKTESRWLFLYFSALK